MLFRLSGRALLILCFLFMPGVAGAVVCPASIAEVIAVLNLGKDPICIGEDSQDNPVSVPLDFRVAGNGALVLLDQLPAGGIGDANTRP